MVGLRTGRLLAAVACAAMVGGSATVALSTGSTGVTAVRPAHRLSSVRVVRSDAMSPRPRVQRFSAASTLPLVYHGGNLGIGVTTGAPKVYLVFWGSQWGTSSAGNDGNTHLSGDPQNIAPRLQSFFKGVGTNNEQWSGVVTQYCEGVSAGTTTCPSSAAHVGYPTGGAYAGVWVDTSSAAPAQASQGQLGAEAVAAAAHFNNTTPTSNRNAQYVVVSPTGTHPDGFNNGANFCAWHAYVPTGSGGSPYGPLAFTNLPYIPDMGWSCGAGYVNGGSGALDGVTIVEGHEYSETVTDQTLGAWYDANGQENADRCAWNGTGGTGGAQDVTFADGSFPVQASWSNDGSACRISHPIFGAVPSNFSMTATSVPSVRQGAAGTSTIRTTATGQSVPVTLSTSGVPSGVTVSFDNNPVASGSNAVMTLTTSYGVAPGRYSIVVTGTANNGTTITHSVTVPLTVTVGKDFSLSGGSLSVRQGASGVVHLPVRSLTSDLASVTFTTGTLPTGITAQFDTNPITAGGTANLTLSADPNTAPGRYSIKLTGTASSGGATVSHDVTITLTVTLGNDFSMSGNSITVHRGNSGVVNLTTHVVAGSATVSLATGDMPAGMSAVFGSTSVTSGSGTTLTFTVGSLMNTGRYAITVTATASSGPATVTHTVTVYVTVLA